MNGVAVEQRIYQGSEDGDHGHQEISTMIGVKQTLASSSSELMVHFLLCITMSSSELCSPLSHCLPISWLHSSWPEVALKSATSKPLCPFHALIYKAHVKAHSFSMTRCVVNRFMVLITLSLLSENCSSALKFFWLLNCNLLRSHCWHHLAALFTCQEVSEAFISSPLR